MSERDDARDALARATATVEEEDERVGVVGRGRMIDRIFDALTDADWDALIRYRLTPERTTHEPGDHHRYRMECEVCGQRGTVRLTLDPERAE